LNNLLSLKNPKPFLLSIQIGNHLLKDLHCCLLLIIRQNLNNLPSPLIVTYLIQIEKELTTFSKTKHCNLTLKNRIILYSQITNSKLVLGIKKGLFLYNASLNELKNLEKFFNSRTKPYSYLTSHPLLLIKFFDLNALSTTTIFFLVHYYCFFFGNRKRNILDSIFLQLNIIYENLLF
jgi:hypothetical protein